MRASFQVAPIWPFSAAYLYASTGCCLWAVLFAEKPDWNTAQGLDCGFTPVLSSNTLSSKATAWPTAPKVAPKVAIATSAERTDDLNSSDVRIAMCFFRTARMGDRAIAGRPYRLC